MDLGPDDLPRPPPASRVFTTTAWRSSGYFNPFVPDTVSHYQEGVDNGYLITDEDGEVYTFKDPATRDASLIDLTNPDAVAWLQGFQTTAADDLGIDGWMADFAEWLPVDAQLDSGVSAWQFHNQYPLAWQRANRGSLADVHTGEDANNWTYFVRSGWASVNGGYRRHRPGDVGRRPGHRLGLRRRFSDHHPHRRKPRAWPAWRSTAVTSPATTRSRPKHRQRVVLSLVGRGGLSPADAHPPRRRRMRQLVLRPGHETIEHFRRYAAIHALLYPYFQSLLPDARERGWPITRHPYLVEPDRHALWSDDNYEWFVGDDILVAAGPEQGATQRVVTLPSGDWWPLFGDAPVESTKR